MVLPSNSSGDFTSSSSPPPPRSLPPRSSPPCPCCVFLPDDLFLPKGTSAIEAGLDDYDDDQDHLSNNNHDITNRNDSDNKKDHLVSSSDFPVTCSSSSPAAAAPLSPQEAWDALLQWQQNQKQRQSDSILLVDTHGHTHLERESQEMYRINKNYQLRADTSEHDSSVDNQDDHQLDDGRNNNTFPKPTMLSLTCSVQESDWQACLDYAGQSQYRMAALGIHPWYLHEFSIHNDGWLHRLEQQLQQHAGILVGEIGLCKMARLVRFPAEQNTTKQEALALQRHVFVEQFKLAARYQRPVSVHCVQQHGVLLEILQNTLWLEDDPKSKPPIAAATMETKVHDNDKYHDANTTNPEHQQRESKLRRLPPAIALHSFSGTSHQVQQLLQLENELFHDNSNSKGANRKQQKKSKPRRQQANKSNDDGDGNGSSAKTPQSTLLEKDHNALNRDGTNAKEQSQQEPQQPQQQPQHPPLLYFGFSHSINYAMCSSEKSRRQGVEAIRAVPMDRLLVESDVHSTDNLVGGTAGALAYVAWALNQPLLEVARRTQANALRFLAAVRPPTSLATSASPTRQQ
ncbi:hypothetical protein ACA910_000290 [Epithemia clementina (nom. ined.)]